MTKNDLKENKMAKGFISIEDLKKVPSYPSEERFKRGPVAVIECLEEIPCNPCETACSRNAIKVGYPITNRPVLVDEAACNGCGNCIIKCPGLAIFVVNKAYSEEKATIVMPYELLPLPEKGSNVVCLDRKGNAICEGIILKVLSGKALNKTNLITVLIPKEYADVVRFFKIKDNV